MSLVNALTEIHGIGDAKAEDILDVVDQYYEQESVGDAEYYVKEAYEYYKAGQMNQVETHLEYALEEL